MSLSNALAVAIEALSWIEIEGMSERQAVFRSSNQLEVKDPRSLRLSQLLVLESTRRRNLLDKLLSLADPSLRYENMKAGPRSFARVYTYWTVIRGANRDTILALLRAGRKLLGWRELAPLELTFGRMLGLRSEDVFSEASETQAIALRTFNPEWFVDYCMRTFGRKKAMEILKGEESLPPTYIRINTLAEDESVTVEKMKQTDTNMKKVRGMKYVYSVLRSRGPMLTSKIARLGNIQVQDKSSCLTVLAAKPRPRQVVLDVCAAPGTKTSFLAQLMRNRGTIYAIDISERRMNLWMKEMKRMNVKIANPLVADVRQPLPLGVDADVVVLDPPCSNSGTFAKVPSAKWRIRLSDFNKFSQIQLQMLHCCADRVRIGGRLIYSTCSISVEENEEVIEAFLRQDPRFRLTDFEPKLGEPGMRGLDKCRRFYPHLDDCNGYFTAAMIRNAC